MRSSANHFRSNHLNPDSPRKNLVKPAESGYSLPSLPFARSLSRPSATYSREREIGSSLRKLKLELINMRAFHSRRQDNARARASSAAPTINCTHERTCGKHLPFSRCFKHSTFREISRAGHWVGENSRDENTRLALLRASDFAVRGPLVSFRYSFVCLSICLFVCLFACLLACLLACSRGRFVKRFIPFIGAEFINFKFVFIYIYIFILLLMSISGNNWYRFIRRLETEILYIAHKRCSLSLSSAVKSKYYIFKLITLKMYELKFTLFVCGNGLSKLTREFPVLYTRIAIC